MLLFIYNKSMYIKVYLYISKKQIFKSYLFFFFLNSSNRVSLYRGGFGLLLDTLPVAVEF